MNINDLQGTSPCLWCGTRAASSKERSGSWRKKQHFDYFKKTAGWRSPTTFPLKITEIKCLEGYQKSIPPRASALGGTPRPSGPGWLDGCGSSNLENGKDGNKSHLEMIRYWRLLTMPYSRCNPNLQVVSHWLYQYCREQMGKMNSLFVPPSWAGNETKQRSLVEQPFCRIKIKSKEIRKEREDEEIQRFYLQLHEVTHQIWEYLIIWFMHPYGI